MTTNDSPSTRTLLRCFSGGRDARARRAAQRGIQRLALAVLIATATLVLALPAAAHHDRHHRHRSYDRDIPRDWERAHQPRDRGVYAELEAGVAALPDTVVHGPFVDGELDLASGFVTGGAIGAQVTPFLRLEGAMNYREALVDSFAVEGFISTDEGSFGAFSTFANAYVDLAIPGSPVTPFVGAGVGIAVVSLETYDPFEDVDIDDDSVQLAWNLTAGASWRLSERVDFVTRYRYFATENLDEEYQDGTLRLGEADVELESHEAVLGVRFHF